MLRIEALPAAHGDCLWIEWGSRGKTRRMLVDGGPAHTYASLRERMQHLPADERRFELFVITHIDADHIEGAIRLLQDSKALGIHFERIWFNGRAQLDAVPDEAGDDLGAAQGEYLSLLIGDYEKAVGRSVWNADCPGPFVARQEDALVPVPLLGDATVTILSPDVPRLIDLKDHWSSELRDAELDVGSEANIRQSMTSDTRLRPIGDELGDDEPWFDPSRLEWPGPDDAALDDELGGEEKTPGSDKSPANGSSIALLFEYDGRAALLAGDAFPGVLETSIDRLLGQRGRKHLALDVFKLPHHGSVANVTAELLQKLRCRHYLISTSGVLFGHPDRATIELLLENHKGRGHPALHFNYRSVTTEPWADGKRQKRERFRADYPSGITLDL